MRGGMPACLAMQAARMSGELRPAWAWPVAAAATASADEELDQQFECFLAEENEALLKFLCTRLPTREDAQDAAQESMVRMVRYRDREPGSAWKRLLYRIAVNVAHDHIRYARARGAHAQVSYEDALDATPADEPAHEEKLDQQRMLAEISRIVLTLPPRSQEIFLLNRVEGMTYVQVAEYCGISLKAVEKHMARALAALRGQLGKPGR